MKTRQKSRRGFSLLEVILAIAILGGSMVVIGHGFYLGYRSVRNARMISAGNRIADSAMAEISAGAVEPVSTSGKQVPGEEGWTYSIESQNGNVPGLLSVVVTVQNTRFQPNVRVSITRLVVDPNYDPLDAQGGN